MSPVLEVCLPRSGFARNFPRVVLFGPHKYQGQGLSHPWHTQEIMKLGVLWEPFTKAVTGIRHAFDQHGTVEIGVWDRRSHDRHPIFPNGQGNN